MKLIKENKYKGNVSRTIIKSAVTFGLVGMMFFTGFNNTDNIDKSEILYYEFISQDEKQNFVNNAIKEENILPINNSDITDDKKLDEIVEKIQNDSIKSSDGKIFRDYVLKNFIQSKQESQKSELTSDEISKFINSRNGIDFKIEGLNYRVAVDFSDKLHENNLYISQSISNKKIQFLSTRFNHKSINAFFNHYSYEIIVKEKNIDGINSILIENNNASDNQSITITINFSDNEQVITNISKENMELLKKNLLENFSDEYDIEQFKSESEEILSNVLVENFSEEYPKTKQLKNNN